MSDKYDVIFLGLKIDSREDRAKFIQKIASVHRMDPQKFSFLFQKETARIYSNLDRHVAEKTKLWLEEMGAIAKIELHDPKPKKQMAYRKCPVCGGFNKLESVKCSSCATDFRQPPKTEQAQKNIPDSSKAAISSNIPSHKFIQAEQMQYSRIDPINPAAVDFAIFSTRSATTQEQQKEMTQPIELRPYGHDLQAPPRTFEPAVSPYSTPKSSVQQPSSLPSQPQAAPVKTIPPSHVPAADSKLPGFKLEAVPVATSPPPPFSSDIQKIKSISSSPTIPPQKKFNLSSDPVFPAGQSITTTGSSTATITAKPKYQEDLEGVKGWLLFFCIVLLLLVPVYRVVLIVDALNSQADMEQNPLIPVLFKDIIPLLHGEIAFNAGIFIFSIIAGLFLILKKPVAPKVARLFLLFVLLIAIADGLMLYNFMSGLESELGSTFFWKELKSQSDQEIIRSIASALVFVGIWWSYLSRSERVRLTYSK